MNDIPKSKYIMTVFLLSGEIIDAEWEDFWPSWLGRDYWRQPNFLMFKKDGLGYVYPWHQVKKVTFKEELIKDE